MHLVKLVKVGAVFAALSLGLSACASGPSLSESPQAKTTLPSGMSRIVVYRTGIMGAAIQPVVKVDGRSTGKCQTNGVFFVDVPSGQHQLSATTESSASTLVDTSETDIAYVKCSLGMGLVVGRPTLEVVPTATGASEAADLSLTGSF